MAQANQKISLNTGREIRFNRLVLSQQNVCKTKAGISIEELVDDVAHRGLLTNLNLRVELDVDGKETNFVKGITALSRVKAHQDTRLELEGRARKLLENAA